MGKIINILPMANREDNLQEIMEALQEVKDALVEVLDQYEDCLLYTSDAADE